MVYKMSNKHFQKILDRVMTTPPSKLSSSEDYFQRQMKFGSLLLLFMENCRLCAFCVKKANLITEGVSRKQLLNLFNNKWSYYGDVYEYMVDVREKLNVSGDELYLYLSWHLHKEEIDAMGYSDMPDPYEPLWYFVLRGGGTIKEVHGFIDICGSEFSMIGIEPYLKKDTPFIDIKSEESYQKADIEYLENRTLFLEQYIEPYLKINRLL